MSLRLLYIMLLWDLVSERVIHFRAQKSMPPDNHVLTKHVLKSPRGLVDEPTRALHTDLSKEEEFASIIEVSEAYTDIYEY